MNEDTDSAPLVTNPQIEVWRKKLQYLLHNLFARVSISVLIVADIIIAIVQMASKETIFPLEVVSLVFATIFMIETAIRIFAKTLKLYFTRPFCVFEFFVVVSTFALSIATIVLYAQSQSSTVVEYIRFVSAILRVFRILKMLRVFRFLTEWFNLIRSARYTTGQNKRRYIADGFDLDLCYITDQIIAMSFPSLGFMSLYRNPIRKVAEFFNKKHSEKYLVLNMCSERGYDASYFNGNARRFLIDDHYPPFFEELVEIVDVMQEWLGKSEQHVVAVHCRGGKGRTGTVICACLLAQGNFHDTTTTLDYFAGQRTDLEVGSKYQGVETPSQGRYLKYFEKYLATGCAMPAKRRIAIKRFRIGNLLAVERDVLADLSFRIYQGRKEIYVGNCFFNIGCSTKVDEQNDLITITVENPPTVYEDVKIVFLCKKLPTHYWRSAFYFIFHTGFLPEPESAGTDGSLKLPRAELDNPHKLAKFYGDQFYVETVYRDV